jgi:ATP-dependent exoDNAse (exonuclease V) beta subunit
MSDESVAQLLRSQEPLVLIEAAAGCGKTYQGASYAKDIAGSLENGRLLILTHTHAACSVFAARTGKAGAVEISTIDSLIAQIAGAYHKSLDLPQNLASWAHKNDGSGFKVMATKVAAFLTYQPMIIRALVTRYPVIICDEHQDSSEDQHSVLMALYRGGAQLRIFGDPLQRIYNVANAAAGKKAEKQWDDLKRSCVCDKLDYPHRWQNASPELGGVDSVRALKP